MSKSKFKEIIEIKLIVGISSGQNESIFHLKKEEENKKIIWLISEKFSRTFEKKKSFNKSV